MGMAAVFGAEYKAAKNDKIDNSYIVVMKEAVSQNDVDAHKSWVKSLPEVQVKHEWSIIKGYNAIMDKAALAEVMQRAEVDYVEEDQMAHALFQPRECIEQQSATWGLVRTSERSLRITGEYDYSSVTSGQGVTSYVIDTGIYIEHTEFEGRASYGASFITGETDTDGNGHGTHCAGTIGGKTYGLAKKVKLVAVKVLSRGGSGSYAGVISGIDWVASNAAKPATANMSLGGGFSAAVNAAVNAAVERGIVFVLAAGNDNRDAATYSPASAGGTCGSAITVVSSDNSDRRSSFSNFGTCTNIIAPGTSITSAWINSPTAINTISGTSMAAPHVCGVASRYMSSIPSATPAAVKDWMNMQGTDGTVTGVPTPTPNVLLFADCNNL